MTVIPRHLLTATLLLLTTACTILPTTKPDTAFDSWAQHRATMSAISAWHLRGKMGITSGDKGGTATLVWKHHAAQDDIELYGPFGSGRVTITADRDRATLTDARGSTAQGATAAEVLYRRLGWRVPFAELRYWVRGIPAGDDGAEIKFDAAGRLESLREQHWTVEYKNYVAVDGLYLPQKFVVTTDRAILNYSEKKLRVTIVLKHWREIEVE